MAYLRKTLKHLTLISQSTKLTGLFQKRSSFQVFNLCRVHSKATKRPTGIADAQKSLNQASQKSPSNSKSGSFGTYFAIILGSFSLGLLSNLGVDGFIAHWKTRQDNSEEVTEENDCENCKYLEMPDKIKKLIQEEVFDLNIQNRFVMFVADSVDPVSIGHDNRFFTSAIGIPRFICYWDSLQDVDFNKVHLRAMQHDPRQLALSSFQDNFTLSDNDLSEKLDFNEIQELKETFVLSQDAKRFVIRKQLLEHLDVRWKIAVSGVLYGLVGLTCVRVSALLKVLPQFKAPVNFTLMTFWCLMSCLLHLQAESDMTERVNDLLKSQNQAKGAKEYFSKQIRRSELISKVYSPDKLQQFLTESGQVPSCLGTTEKKLPKTQLQFFEECTI